MTASCPGCHWNHRRTSMLQTKFLPIASGCSGICRRTVSPLYARARNPVRLRWAEQSMPGQSLPVFAWFLTGNRILFSPRGGVLYASKTHSFWLSSLPGPMAGGPAAQALTLVQRKACFPIAQSKWRASNSKTGPLAPGIWTRHSGSSRM